jgi:hypothetical protein
MQRSTARGDKVAQLKQKLARFGDKLEVVDVPDIAKGTFPLEGVDAVMHTASPLETCRKFRMLEWFSLCFSLRNFWKTRCQGAIQGSINVIRQTHAAGIKRFIYTSSIVATHPDGPNAFTDKGMCSFGFSHAYFPIYLLGWTDTKLEKDLWKTYAVSKTVAERAVWEFGEKHTELDITVCKDH